MAVWGYPVSGNTAVTAVTLGTGGNGSEMAYFSHSARCAPVQTIAAHTFGRWGSAGRPGSGRGFCSAAAPMGASAKGRFWGPVDTHNSRLVCVVCFPEGGVHFPFHSKMVIFLHHRKKFNVGFHPGRSPTIVVPKAPKNGG